MAKEFLTDEQVEMEIQRLRESPMVKLARREINIKNRRRQTLYQLRSLEKRGIQLAEDGYTLNNIEYFLGCEDEIAEEECAIEDIDSAEGVC